MKVNTICEILYEVKAKAIIKALAERQQKVEKKTLGDRVEGHGRTGAKD